MCKFVNDMKKFFTAFLLLLALMPLRAEMTLSVGGVDLTGDTTIVVTDFEDDPISGVMMTWTGSIRGYQGTLSVDIARTAGVQDELCIGTSCQTGNGQASETKTYALQSANSNVYAHFYPAAAGRQTIVYTFRGDVTRVLTVHYDYLTGFPRKFLIDHFTGEDCGFCPYGMYCITDFMAKDPNRYIWLSHHYGYNNDEYTIPANSVVGSSLGVAGAPSAAINRTARRVNGKVELCFHPGYLEDQGAVSVYDSTKAEASIHVEPYYDEATHELEVVVYGQSLRAATQYKLSIFVKESGMVGKQADYYYKLDSHQWSQFVHTNTARTVLTAALGDVVTVSGNAYEATHSTTLDASWQAANCCVVAVLTDPTTGAVINCEEMPVVDGTDGGASVMAGPVIPEGYPEYNVAPVVKYALVNKTVTDYSATNSLVVVDLFTNMRFRYNGTPNCIQRMRLWFVQTTSTVQPGVYPINDSGEPATVYAGSVSRIGVVDGSTWNVIAISDSTLYGSYGLASGQVTVYDNGAIHIEATTLNGFAVDKTYGNVPVGIDQIDELLLEPIKQLRNGKVLIRRGKEYYGVMGERVY